MIIILTILGFVFYKKESEFINYESLDFEENIILNVVNQNNEIIEEKSKIKVYITGEVNNPGVKELDEGARIEDVINVAGGLTKNANIEKVNLAYTIEDGQKIYIPNFNEEIEEYITKENGDGIIENYNSYEKTKININKANANELINLPGVGEALANRIVNFREENGKFKKIEDLKKVSGIGDSKFEKLKEYIIVK